MLPPLVALAGHRAQLAYERGRAANALQALAAAWRAGRQRRAARAVLPAAARRALALAEQHSLALGLAWPRESQEQCAPWHLSSRVLSEPPASLPPHPLIEPAWAAGRLDVRGGALDLLDAVASPERRATLWSGLPLEPLADPPRLGVVLHLFYPALWPEIRQALAALPEPAALYVTVPEFAATPALRQIAADWCGPLQFLPVPNRGRDVRPFLQLLCSGTLDAHELVCKLHTKRSPHMRDGEAWRQASLQALLGPDALAGRLEAMRGDSSAGLWCAAADRVGPQDRRRWNTHSHTALRRQLALLGWAAEPGKWEFAAGTMFWMRPEALRGLRIPGLNELSAYEPEMAQTDGTWAHALERLIGLAVTRAGAEIRVLG